MQNKERCEDGVMPSWNDGGASQEFSHANQHAKV